MSTILAFIATTGGKATLISLAVWIFSMCGKSAWYWKLRESVGRAAEAAGAALSALGTSRLKFLWNPTELVLCDFLFFAIEQFAVGLRKDNPEKMERQLDRLESVGSQTRADAMAVKIAALGKAPQVMETADDAAIAFQATFDANQSIKDKLVQ
ncbi:MAG: hypothetical protein ABIY63_13295 [Fibrobacteria bacterium]